MGQLTKLGGYATLRASWGCNDDDDDDDDGP